MSTSVSIISGRIAAVLLLAGLIAFVAVVIVMPAYGRYQANKKALVERTTQLFRLRVILQSTRALAANGQGGGQDSGLSKYRQDFLHGQRDASIIAKLQSRLRAVVVGNRSRLNSARSLPSRKIGTLTYLGLRLQLRGPPQNIHKIIGLIENSTPLLTIERAILRLDHRHVAAGQKVPELVADLDIYSAKWPQAVAARKKEPRQ